MINEIGLMVKLADSDIVLNSSPTMINLAFQHVSRHYMNYIGNSFKFLRRIACSLRSLEQVAKKGNGAREKTVFWRAIEFNVRH